MGMVIAFVIGCLAGVFFMAMAAAGGRADEKTNQILNREESWVNDDY